MPIIQPHGRNLPDGRQVAQALQALWLEQGERFARTGEVESIRPTEQEEAKLQYLFEQLLGPLWKSAWLEALYRVRLQEMNSGREREPILRAYGGIIEISVWPIKKELVNFATAFDIYNEAITDFISQQVYHFLRSVNDTTEELLRTTIFVSESEGFTPIQRTRAVQEIFVDPKRSFLISNTEASRAVHGGDYEATVKTGLCDKKKFLVSSDACTKICQPLARLGTIPIDQPFAVSGKGYYGTIMYAPAHPGCMCTVKYILAKQPEE